MIKRYIYAAIAAAVLGLGGYTYYSLRADAKAAALAPVKDAVIKQQAAVKAADQRAREKTDAVNARTREQELADARRLRDLAAAEQRLRDNAAESERLARASAQALRDYASDLRQDFAECRREYVALGETAAGASRAAHALNDAWATVEEWNKLAAEFGDISKGIK